jgi:broad specificity phosphatase PhoE
MVARQVHLVRHGEVFNPDRVLYGRLPNFGLSERGALMAEAAAAYLVALNRPIAALICSPLQRTQESAAPVAKLLGLTPLIDERIIEPTNVFEGKRMRGPDSALRDPANWKYLRNPWRPSWGEPYRSIASRMLAAMTDAVNSTEAGDIVMVSHQLPIMTVHRALANKSFMNDPRRRRCALSSITTCEWRDETFTERGFVEVGYADPAAPLSDGAIDVGAV